MSRFVLRLGRIALPTNDEILASAIAGSEPFKGVKGEPLCSENCELTCQPPSTWPVKPLCACRNGNSYTKLPATRCGRSKLDRARSERRLYESCATAISPDDTLKISDIVSIN